MHEATDLAAEAWTIGSYYIFNICPVCTCFLQMRQLFFLQSKENDLF